MGSTSQWSKNRLHERYWSLKWNISTFHLKHLYLLWKRYRSIFIAQRGYVAHPIKGNLMILKQCGWQVFVSHAERNSLFIGFFSVYETFISWFVTYFHIKAVGKRFFRTTTLFFCHAYKRRSIPSNFVYLCMGKRKRINALRPLRKSQTTKEFEYPFLLKVSLLPSWIGGIYLWDKRLFKIIAFIVWRELTILK